MKKILALLGAALGFALLITGCETDASSARIQEKSAAYGTLKPWEKKYVDQGIIAVSFTPDMVYMAIGKPSTAEPMDGPGGKTELWTYKNYYPTVAADQVKYTLNTQQPNQMSQTGPGLTGGGHMAPRGMAGAQQSTTSGPQGGSMEPADLTSYTLSVTFQDGKVSQLKLVAN